VLLCVCVSAFVSLKLDLQFFLFVKNAIKIGVTPFREIAGALNFCHKKIRADPFMLTKLIIF
jgi:hypothetical protein